jgi:hypothetical protein
MGKAEIKGLDIDDLVMLKADLVAIEGGEEYASILFPSQVSEAKIVDLKDKLKAKVGIAATTTAAAEQTAEPEVHVGVDIQVRIGAKPFTWFANDGVSEYLVSESHGVYTCNCTPKCTDCAHVAATQRFATQA